MESAIEVIVEPDPERPKLYQVAIHDYEGTVLDVPARGLELAAANRESVHIRAAFLAGARWMRDYSTSYLLQIRPYIVCSIIAGSQK